MAVLVGPVMFASFERTQNTATARRMAASLVTSAAICAGLAAAALAFQGRARPIEKEAPKVDVVFRPPPVPVVELPPPPPPRQIAKSPPRPAAPAALVAPKEIVVKPIKEAAVEAPVAARELAVGGTGDGSGIAAAKAEVAPPSAEVEARPVSAGPVQLPEDAEPPEELEGNVRPEFPESARANGVEGLVVLKIVVEKDGRVGKIAVMKGEEPFVAAATAAVKTWKYAPAQLEGQSIAVFRVVKIPFRLKA